VKSRSSATLFPEMRVRHERLRLRAWAAVGMLFTAIALALPSAAWGQATEGFPWNEPGSDQAQPRAGQAQAGQPATRSQAAQDLDWLISILQDDARRQALLDALRARAGSTATRAEPAPAAQPSAPPQQAPPAAQASPQPAPAPQAGASQAPAAPTPRAAAPEAEKLVTSMSEQVRVASERALRFAASIANLPKTIADEFRSFRNPAIRAQRLDALWRVLAAIAGGLLIEWICVRLLTRVNVRFDISRPVTVFGRLFALILRAFVDAVPVAAFVATAVVALGLLQAPTRAHLAAVLLIYAHVTVRAVMIASRVLVAPGTSNLRLFPITDETAQYLYIWIRRLALIGIYGTFATEATRFFGVTLAARTGVFKAIGGLLTLLIVIVVLQNRSAVSRAIAYEGASALLGIRRTIADVWHILAILYIVGLFGVWLFDVRGGFEYLARGSLGTLIVIGTAWLIIAAVKRIVARAFRLHPDLNWRFPGLELRANRYLPIFRDGVRLIIWLIAALLVLQVWGVKSLQWLSSRTGVQFIGTLLAIGLVLLIALVIWESLVMALERYAARLAARGAGGARARTLLPLFRTTALIVLIVLAGLVILTQIGVNITPLLAGAGVVGLAVGFGSQKLVQDVINGVFMLLENTVSVGDVVDLGGGHAGAVEAIGIRTMRLRDGNGTVHTIPFSEVKTVMNMTRDFAKGLFEIEVAYSEDVDRVMDAMKAVGEEISKDKTYAPLIIEPFSIIGVDKVKGSGVVVLGQISTLPGKQWDVSRAYNHALKKRFDQIEIKMPTGRATIYVQGLGAVDATRTEAEREGKAAAGDGGTAEKK
jgi:moderate conductance mechanosensitive channel